MLVIVIAAYISVGIAVETSTVFIVQSNMKIVLNQRIESFDRPYIYILLEFI